MKNILIQIIAIMTLTIVIGLTSCKTVEPLTLTDVNIDRLYRDIETNDTITIANIHWEQLFTDIKLQALINEAIANNTDNQIALSRIKSAEANFQAATMSLFPSLNINGNSSFTFNEGNSRIASYQLTGASSWEIDIWGKLGNTRKAYKAALMQSEAYQRSIQTSLIANVASSYYNLLALDEQLRITEQTYENRKESSETMRLLKESNIVNSAAVVQSQANMYSTQVTIPTLKQSIFEAENNLCALLGRQAGSIDRGTFNDQNVDIDLKTGVPAQMLANRPDIQQATYQVDYYLQQLNIARKSFLPSITITGQGGLSDDMLSKLFNPIELFANIVGGITQPIFNKGLNKKNFIIAQSNLEEGLASYKQTLLNAGNEVSGYIHSYQSATERLEIRTNQIEYLTKSVEYTRELLRYSSTTNYTDVLTSEQGLLSAQLNNVSDKLQQLQAVINLYRSLGGGWISTEENRLQPDLQILSEE